MCLSDGTSSKSCSGRGTLVPQCHHAALGYRRRPVGRTAGSGRLGSGKTCFWLSSGFVWMSCNSAHARVN